MTFFCPKINILKFQLTLLWFTVFLLFNQAVFAVEITATLDRNPVNINTSFQLTYTATQSPDGNPDFSPLKNNFEILKQSHSSNSSWINGQSTKTIQWILNVMAKQTGHLLIPAIAFGDDVSKPISIEVSNKVVAKQNNTEDLFLEVEVFPETIYVQSQILYTLRLYRRVQLAQANLTEPKMADAVIEKLTEDSTYNTDINGIAYVVTERKYAVFPQKSGVSTIEPLVLTADIVMPNSRQRFNSFFNRPKTKTKRISSKAITLNVLPPPDSFKTSHWIPAELVHIKEKWSGDIAKMKLGEPLTRTITLLAKGTTVAQLPELQGVTLSNGLKTYPDQPLLKEEKEADGIIAFREEKIAYIPSKPGSYTLPAIEVPWFNSRTQQMEIARIPETTVTTIGTIASVENVAVNTTVAKTSPVIVETLDTPRKENKFWMGLSLFLSLCWLITLVFLFRKQKPQQIENPADTKEMSLQETIKKLKQACANNDQLAAKNALLVWGKIKFNSNSLSEISSHCQARLRDEINCLNKNLYAEQTTSWEGKKLFQFYSENKAREKVSIKTDDGLDPLYKL
ncbi:MAG: protein BatD [Methylococcales symbiont of Hymedesmia sp. n. MRB-2018]|nr:MAG: protein BatD [Methylococcales symbiont of Hymedesmia sp. n. MRB-2018]KAF3984647.1 MAG: protein BatD [Methylococcales symbiont of Hymedesmia sp. n. MRB-2018]